MSELPTVSWTVTAALTLAAGGTLKQAIISAAISFAQLPLPGGGGIWGMVGDAVVASGTGFVGTVVTHAVIGGALSVAQGGSFVSGAISGAVGAVGSGIAGALGTDSFSRVAISAVAGGTASVLAGGKFANGAITAAFATMYNDLQDHTRCLSGIAWDAKWWPRSYQSVQSNLYDDMLRALACQLSGQGCRGNGCI